MPPCARLTPWVLWALALGCDGEHESPWLALSEVDGQPALARVEEAVLPDGQRVRFEEIDGEVWGTVALGSESWRASKLRNVLQAPSPLIGLGRPRYRLEIGGTPCPQVSAEAGQMKLQQRFQPGTFGFWRGSVFLGVEPGGAPPERATLAVRVDPAELDPAGRIQLNGRRFSGQGLPVWPGSRVERVLDVPAGSALRFGSAVETASSLYPAGSAHVFRVRLDGQEIFTHRHELDPAGSHAWHTVALPERRAARLAFEVEGPFAYTSFIDPIVGPAEVGSYGARPWPARPSIVLFLADTFRADNLAFYGGPPGVTPELERFAEQSVRFANAWSVGTFTLPGHAALFSGFYPRQTSTDAFAHALPDEVETIAELLSRAGYRTGAITDSAVVSLRFGMHQGFGWFDECDLELESTLERARRFLDADDGRPVFLFVQTYRTHLPYRAEEVVGDAREGSNEYSALMAELSALGEDGEAALAREPVRARELAGRLLELYRRGAADLDRGFGRFREDLAARGFPEAGFVLFTSDHGEAFLEHGELTHMGRVFEEQIRIPLLIQGRGLAPRTVEHAASLIDLPPTLCAMAGIAPLPGWLGTNLLGLGSERRLFAFECSRDERSTVAILAGTKKLIAHEETEARKLVEPWQAFDLARDPRETENVLDDGNSAWPAELYRSSAELVDALLVPLFTGESSALDADRIEQLEALGYAAD